jgi:hypothetical protein
LTPVRVHPKSRIGTYEECKRIGMFIRAHMMIADTYKSTRNRIILKTNLGKEKKGEENIYLLY